MKPSDFRKHAHQFVDWMADYLENVEDYPVKSQVNPGDIYSKIPTRMPEDGESIESVFSDFENIIMPGITHWQSPNFFAYFQANSSPQSVLAEMLTATLGIQGMKWETSPAATELEESMMDWLMSAMAIPESWAGVIQDTASTATLAAIISARERVTEFSVNERGFQNQPVMRLYCSAESHSSIEKGAKIAGLGKANVVKVEVDEHLGIRPAALRNEILKDIENGYKPTCIVVAIGTTGTLAVDPLRAIGEIASEFNIWLHVDAAYAGSALLLPEYHHLVDGIELADSFVFNPHKWLFTNFDCTAYFVKDEQTLLNTFAILPEYLKTKSDGQVNNYCDWGIPLGRRFRALKLWFVLRSYGMEGLQNTLRAHIDMAEWLESQIDHHPEFELTMIRTLNLVCFRYTPARAIDPESLNAINEELLHTLNGTGKIYLTHTVVQGKYTLRMSIGRTNIEKRHVENAWDLIVSTAENV